MANYEDSRVKLTNSQLNKLKSAAKNKTGTILRSAKRNFQDEKLPHELLLTTRQKTKIRNAFANNISRDRKLIKAQLLKIIQSYGYLGTLLGKLAGPLIIFSVPLAKILLTPLATMASTSAIDGAIQRKMCGSGAGALRAKKRNQLIQFQMKIWMILLES